MFNCVVTNVLFIFSLSWLIFTNVRQGAPGKILPRAANWPGPALHAPLNQHQAWVDRKSWWSNSWYRQSQIGLVWFCQLKTNPVILSLLSHHHGTGFPKSIISKWLRVSLNSIGNNRTCDRSWQKLAPEWTEETLQRANSWRKRMVCSRIGHRFFWFNQREITCVLKVFKGKYFPCWYTFVCIYFFGTTRGLIFFKTLI